MSTKQPDFPPNVVTYIRGLIERRTKYCIDLEGIPKYYGYDEYSKNQNKKERDSAEENIKKLTQDILAITKKHFPTIEVDPNNDEVTITNVLAALPPPDAVRKISQVSARGQS